MKCLLRTAKGLAFIPGRRKAMEEDREAAMERMMNGQDIVLRATAGKLKWVRAPEIIGD